MSTILAPINNVVAWIITQLFNLFSPVFGLTSGVTWLLTIMVLVVLMRLILVPLFIKQMHTQRAMTALTPRIAELRKKHKGDRETLNTETMKLYQEAGVNPLMGCLPVVLQMPIFFALFSVLRYIAEYSGGKPQYHLTATLIESAQHAKIFGATIADKVLFVKPPLVVPLEAKIVIVLVVIVSMTTTYLTVRQSMKRGMMPTGKDSPMGQSQKLMAYIMPLFALTGLYWQFGLVLYWVTTNLWTLGQQYVLLRKYPVGAAAMGPAGNVPIVGKTGRPATAAGLTGTGTGKPARPGKPGGGSGSSPGKAVPGAPGGSGAGGKGSGAGGKPVSTSKTPGSKTPTSKAPGSKTPTSKTAGGKTPTSKAAGGRTAGGKTQGQAAGKTGQGGKSPGGSGGSTPAAADATPAGSANGHKPGAGEGGVLRRFGRGRSEPEPAEPAEPTEPTEPTEPKIVRQQRTRQSRSKRTGKR